MGAAAKRGSEGVPGPAERSFGLTRLVEAVAVAFGLAGFGAVDAARFLDGRWSGPGLTLAINAATMQANRQPERPFQLEPFRVRDVTHPWIVFMIGKEVFIATLTDDRDRLEVFVGGRPVELRRRR